MQRLPRLQRSSHGLYSRRSWRFLIYRPIQTRLKYMRYLLLSQRVIEIKTQRQASIQSRVPPLGSPISTSCSVLQRSGGIYVHLIVTEPTTSFLCTGTSNLRYLQHQEKTTQIIEDGIQPPSYFIFSPCTQTWRESLPLL